MVATVGTAAILPDRLGHPCPMQRRVLIPGDGQADDAGLADIDIVVSF
jgi:hypothetical protein